MDTVNRPRHSILSLFDPLSSSSSSTASRSGSPDSDKENNAGETSFFGVQKPILSPVQVHKPRRRLIDIGDMTMDEPTIQDLLLEEEEQLEAEIKQSFSQEEENENETLTFRDMAKAATPKWSERRAATVGSPRSPATPRTPLAEIFANDETTPMGRKRPFKRMPTHFSSKSTDSDVGESQTNAAVVPVAPTTSSHDTSPQPTAIPTITVGEDESPLSRSSFSPKNTLGSSVGTLELPTTTDALLSDTPVLISPPSPESHQHGPTPSPPSSGSTLRPNAHLLNHSQDLSRFSVDLHQSFQLHLNSSEATFDLLNDKISFFGGNNSLDSFLEEGPSFGDEDSFGVINQKAVKKCFEAKQETIKVEMDALESAVESDTGLVVEPSAEPLHEDCDAIHDYEEPQAANIEPERATSPQRLSSPPLSIGKCSPTTSIPGPRRSLDQNPPTPHIAPKKTLRSRLSILSTPSTSKNSALQPQAPRPIPALKIVKRQRTAPPSNMTSTSMTTGSTTTTGGASRRTSSVTSVNGLTSRPSSTRASLERAVPVPIAMNHGIGSGQHTKSGSRSVTGAQLCDGPRRVLVDDGPRTSMMSTNNRASIVPAKPLASASAGATGARRVPAAVPESALSTTKPTLPAGSSLKAPTKYATVGPSAAASSSIPKPVSTRNAGSRIPAPASGAASKQGGVLSKGFFGRRVV